MQFSSRYVLNCDVIARTNENYLGHIHKEYVVNFIADEYVSKL